MSTLFVAWQAPDPTRAWFPIGRLDASPDRRNYLFRYTHGALHANKRAGFEPLIAFPSFDRRYEATELFPLFKNRILEPNRIFDYVRRRLEEGFENESQNDGMDAILLRFDCDTGKITYAAANNRSLLVSEDG